MKNKIEKIRGAGTFDELLNAKYGLIVSDKRNEFEISSKSLMIGEMLKEARLFAGMTQDDLARKSGTKKSYISRVENGKLDIQISTLFRIFESGLGRQVNLTII
ncbi:MAG: helix-turn-helix transcriptional regulator [Bacteroidota bacterium]